MKFLIALLFFISFGYSQKSGICGASFSYSKKSNSILLNTPISLFQTEDADYHVRVRLRREVPVGAINGVEYGNMIEQPFFEYDGYKTSMFWAFSTLTSVKHKVKKKGTIDTNFELFYTKKGEYFMTIDKKCYDNVIESNEVSITIK